MKAYGAYTALVSGGFTFFADYFAKRIGFDEAVANVLEFDADNRLTGTVEKPIVDKHTKRNRLMALTAEKGLAPAQTMAVGDGANDLDMLQSAGLGVAIHAKPIVAEQAACPDRSWRPDRPALPAGLLRRRHRQIRHSKLTIMLETEKLILRQWTDADRAPYRAYCADPRVRQFYPSVLTTTETDAMIDRMAEAISRQGFGFFAAERKSDGAIIGDVGISPVPDYLTLKGAPRLEVGWLLGHEFWGQGFAPEAARACLDFAWDTLEAPDVVAFTAKVNTPSQRVMEKIGMARDADGDFEHPKVPQDTLIRSHVLYRIENPRP